MAGKREGWCSMKLATIKIKYKIMVHIVLILVVVSVSLISTTIYHNRRASQGVLESVSKRMRELQELSSFEFERAKHIARRGVVEASGLEAIDKITAIALQNQEEFYDVVGREIIAAGKAVSTTLDAQNSVINSNLDKLVLDSTRSIYEITEAGEKSRKLMSDLAVINVDSLKEITIQSLDRFGRKRAAHDREFKVLREVVSKKIDQVLIELLMSIKMDSSGGKEHEDVMIRALEQLKEDIIFRQKEFYLKILNSLDLQKRILVEESGIIAEKVNWASNRELENSSATQFKEAGRIAGQLTQTQVSLRKNITVSSDQVKATIDSLKKNLPEYLEKKGEATNRKIKREIVVTRAAVGKAKKMVAMEIDENTGKALNLFEAKIKDSQQNIGKTLTTSLQKMTTFSLLITAICTFMAVLVSFFMIRSLTNPIARVLQFAGRMAEGHLDERLPEGPDEMGEMGRALNTMARELRKLEEATLNSFNQTLDQIHDCVFMLEPEEFNFIYVNQGVVGLLGYSREEMLTMSPFDIDINLASTYETLRENLDRLIENGSGSYDFSTALKARSGVEIPVEVSVKYVIPPKNEPRFVAIVRDITDKISKRKENDKLQARLLQREKLESVGRLAAGIAHEINTPVQFVATNIDFLGESHEDIRGLVGELESVASNCGHEAEEKFKAALENADWEFLQEEIPAAILQSREGIDRVSSIVMAMKEFSHPGSRKRAPADLNKLIETALTVARNEWKYHAEIKKNLAENLKTVPLVVDEMGQVILNLIVNAANAIEERNTKEKSDEKGIIEISTKNTESGVEIVMKDNGTGIPDDIINRIFDPFFTTKEVGKGSGQGLAICHDVIAKKHNGSIDVNSRPGEGTVFTIYLPDD
jgi:PAS domain S-box-containing protein